MLELDNDVEQGLLLRAGMYVRIPFGEDRPDSDFREFRLGQVQSIDTTTSVLTVLLQLHSPGANPVCTTVERSISQAVRCRILPDTKVTHLPTSNAGHLLVACEDQFSPREFCYYYVLLEGQVLKLPESELLAPSHRHDPDPWQQISSFELHNPIWKTYRDTIISSYAQLRNATYGMEDLVGSRILLLAHQAEVVARVLGDTNCRYLLGDEVGLGKTIEASVTLKALRRRNPALKTLIVAPAALVGQWAAELDSKFWLTFRQAHIDAPASYLALEVDHSSPGLLVSAEDLSSDDLLWLFVSSQQWGMLIVDEAHHLRKNPALYGRVRTLSSDAERVLILSATPIQRRAAEYLSLLTVLDPSRYSRVDQAAFEGILDAQDTVRKTISYLTKSLTPDTFDNREFVEEMEYVMNELDDSTLRQLVAVASREVKSTDQGLRAAKQALAYVSENYRIESRVIRNRRSALRIDLATRVLNEGFAYVPTELEQAALMALHTYLGNYLGAVLTEPLTTEYCRVLLHAAASSPHALLDLLEERLKHLSERNISDPGRTSHDGQAGDAPQPPFDLSSAAPPRLEAERVRLLTLAAPAYDEEPGDLATLLWHITRWKQETDEAINGAITHFLQRKGGTQHRLVRVLHALDEYQHGRDAHKVVVFSSWRQTLELLRTALKRRYGQGIVAQFHGGIQPDALQAEADRFQADPNCTFLLCDELGGEGRNFQMAEAILHVDLPWTPAQLEQRIGRVDRLGRTGQVISIVPYGVGTLEHDLFRIWQDAFHLFTASMSGMEIALEGIQDELLTALVKSTTNGLADLLPSMVARAEQLREAVEEERYFEEGAINYQRRSEFQDITQRYQDGKLLRDAFLQWTGLEGLSPSYDSSSDTVSFNPRHFNLQSMNNAKLFDLPNMEEALQRARRSRVQELRGTFNRDIAIRREDLIFFAPGNDPWVDAIIANALEADRGRACAVRRSAPELKKDWKGFELLFSLGVNPRPLYEAGFDPMHLFRAQGFLATSIYRMYISLDGTIEPDHSPVARAVRRPFVKSGPAAMKDIHMGQRSGPISPLSQLRVEFPIDIWRAYVQDAIALAEETLDEELEFMSDVAEEALEEFDRRVTGWRAAYHWMHGLVSDPQTLQEIERFEKISAALVAGMRRPIRRLESVGYWHLIARGQP